MFGRLRRRVLLSLGLRNNVRLRLLDFLLCGWNGSLSNLVGMRLAPDTLQMLFFGLHACAEHCAAVVVPHVEEQQRYHLKHAYHNHTETNNL